MWRNPLFAVSVAGTLALGVAATTAIYTVVDGVLLKPLPFPDPGALVRVTADYTALDARDVGLSQPELQDYAIRSGAFESIAGIWPVTANLTGSDRPERVETLLASANYFDLLGATPALGRTFSTRDEIPGIATVAVISDGLWRRGFGADPQVLGRKLRIDEDVYEIIGVMPPSFRHPSQTLETDVDVWAPSGWRDAPFTTPSYSARFMPSAIGRLCARADRRPGARPDREPRGRDAARPSRSSTRRVSGGRRASIRSRDDLVAGVRPGLLVLMFGIAFVMLIAISNISNLLLIRAVARETRSRGAAGARARRDGGSSRVCSWRAACWRWRAARWASSRACGVSISCCGWCPTGCRASRKSRVDHRVFLFAVLTATVAGLLVGIGPALQSVRADVSEHLKSSGRACTAAPGRGCATHWWSPRSRSPWSS